MSVLPITGTWALKSFGLHPAASPSSAALFQPLGGHPLGRIIFTPENYMSCTLTSRDAASPMESPSWIVANDDEVLDAARAMTTYCGPFRVYEQDGQQLLSTNVDIALDPNWIGKPQVRRWELHGDRTLVLRPVQEFTLPVCA